MDNDAFKSHVLPKMRHVSALKKTGTKGPIGYSADVLPNGLVRISERIDGKLVYRVVAPEPVIEDDDCNPEEADIPEGDGVVHYDDE